MDSCSCKLLIVDGTDDKGAPKAFNYTNGYVQYDRHSANCNNYQAPRSIIATWKRYHPTIASDGAKHRIFDAGCGTGLVIEVLVNSEEYSRKDLEIHGGDYSKEMVSIASKKNIYDDLRVANLKEELPYEPDTFDSIVCAGVFLQAEGHCGPECLPNIIRVLKKGGYFITTVRALFYKEIKEEWDRQISASGAMLIEAFSAPYNNHSEGIIFVIQKK